MVREFIAVFRQRVENLDWMSDATREGALRKLDAMSFRVGYPDQWDTTLDSASILAASEGGSLYQNWVEIRKAEQNSTAARQDAKADKGTWVLPVYIANAAYQLEENAIEVPGAVLRAPLYDVNVSYEENLGGPGFLLAHEITRAFDNNGSRYDENGNVSNWWTGEDYATFQILCQEVVEYYDGRECAPGITCNGVQTLSEIIADLGSLACLTQIVSQQRHPDYETLYRTVARTWRLAANWEAVALHAQTNVHATDIVGVILSGISEKSSARP